MNIHPLAEKIREVWHIANSAGDNAQFMTDVDQAIRQWLGEKVKNLRVIDKHGVYATKEGVRKILCLDNKESWCEHINPRDGDLNICEGKHIYGVGKDWKFCPICNAPRPQ